MLALALIFVTGHGWRWRYVVLDLEALPKPPAGGIAGRPPQRPEPGR
jgi:hypothetical protein